MTDTAALLDVPARTQLGTEHRNVAIIGSGPAALTAAIYSARAGLEPVVIAGLESAGGDLMTTTDVENFPGFPEGVQGPELIERMTAQAARFGADIRYEEATALNVQSPVKEVVLESGATVTVPALIFATGSANRRLGLAAEGRLSGRGVSWCATCDGFFFAGQPVAVVGGGDTAMEEAVFLTRFASNVYVIVRGDRLRASAAMQERAAREPKVEFVFRSRVADILGEQRVEGALVDSEDGTSMLDVSAVFIAIGSDPRTHLVHGQLDLTGDGTVAVLGRSSVTSVPGVFAAGDVVDARYRQAITAAASGATAALDAEEYLSTLNPA